MKPITLKKALLLYVDTVLENGTAPKLYLKDGDNHYHNVDEIDLNRLGDTSTNMCDITVPILLQRRTHKKKRINKKWLKRYGYIVKHGTIKGCKMTMDTDGNVEFVSGYLDDKNNSQYMHIPRYGVRVI